MNGPAFQLAIVTPFARPRAIEAMCVNVPGSAGRLGILAGHQPLVAAVQAGLLLVTTPAGERETWQIGEGFLKVEAQGVTLLTRRATRAADLPPDEARALADGARTLAATLSG
ncbi:MAG: F0F1 ATP synthase subunit epsilon [Kiritimatiellae bacterium]|nr:F0F1 ATP synthase subunit epsilon [Kiritimatiellia bacterium]